MTRINLVPVKELCGKHLVAEYRELPRVFKAAKKWFDKGGNPDLIPAKYKMGEGHVKFFYNKLLFCTIRHEHLFDEMVRRGYKPQYVATSLLKQFPATLYGDWVPSESETEISRTRISERIREMVS
jgi:deoxyribonuclease (pyrimidine dimer)